MSDFIKKLSNGDLEAAREEIFAQLYAKTNTFMDEKRKEMALDVYSDQVEESDDTIEEEELKGNQERLDKKPPYDKLTRADFAALRATKKKK